MVVEAGSWWLGDLLWKADTSFGANPKVKKLNSRTKGLIQRLPSEYVGSNVFIGASTMSREEIRRRHRNGIDALMWGTDYPHPEGSCPTPRSGWAPTSATSPSRTPACCWGSTPCAATTWTGRAHRAGRRIAPRPSDLHQDPELRTAHDAIRTARWWFDDYGMEWKG